MKINPLNSRIQQLLLLVLSVFLLTNCQKPPTPEFSYSPVNNPEAGDSIKFVNESLEALSYSWDLGNNTTSSDENPFMIYETAGSVDVTLTATNDAGDASITKTIAINDPTILGLIVYKPDTTILTDCAVWVYDNETDFQDGNAPQFLENTDPEGISVFYNLEPQVYWIVAYKEMDDGIYVAGGRTNALEQNVANLYNILVEFIPDETKKSLGKALIPSDVELLELH